MAEARRVKAMMSAPTPLTSGGEGAAVDVMAADFGGILPQRKVQATPNPLAMAATPRLPGGGATPARGAEGGATPSMRDELGLNDPFAAPQAMMGRVRGGALGGSLRAGLSGLPQPKNQYQVRAEGGWGHIAFPYLTFVRSGPFK